MFVGDAHPLFISVWKKQSFVFYQFLCDHNYFLLADFN